MSRNTRPRLIASGPVANAPRVTELRKRLEALFYYADNSDEDLWRAPILFVP